MRRMLAGLAATMLLLLPAVATTATADTTPGGPTLSGSIEVTSASLLARGVAVDLGLEVICDDGGGEWVTEYGFITIDQRWGRAIARGYGQVPYGNSLVCDGVTANHLQTTVRAEAIPFKTGSALVSAEICLANWDNYQDYGCLMDTVESRLRK